MKQFRGSGFEAPKTTATRIATPRDPIAVTDGTCEEYQGGVGPGC